MNNKNTPKPVDELSLKKTIKYLCSTKVRYPMTNEQVRGWVNQFDDGSEKMLALLILRFLIYRTSTQLGSSLKQAFKLAAKHFTPPESNPVDINWKDILTGKDKGIAFYYGPPKHEFTPPGKSGEIMSRLIKSCIPMENSQLSYPNTISNLSVNERFLLIDDGTYTGTQLIDFIRNSAQFMHNNNQTGIVVGFAHEVAIKELSSIYPNIPIFFGEKITSKECFSEISANWIEDGLWPFPDITPFDLYNKIAKEKGAFEKNQPLGYGQLGCMIAYEHGIPDDSLQLLWDESSTWKPLFKR